MTDNPAISLAYERPPHDNARNAPTRYFCKDTVPGLYVSQHREYRWVKRYRGELCMFDLDGRGMGTAYTTKHARDKPFALGTWLGEAEFFLDDFEGARRPSELKAAGEACDCTVEDCWYGQINGQNLKLCTHFATVIAWDLKVYRWELECAHSGRLWPSHQVKRKLPAANDDDESASCLSKYHEFIARLNDTGSAWAYFSRTGMRRRMWQHVHALKSTEVEVSANDVEPHPHDWPGAVRIKLRELWSDERREWLDNYCSCRTFLPLQDWQTNEVLGQCCKHWLRMNDGDAVASWALVTLSGDTVWESEHVPPGPDSAER